MTRAAIGTLSAMAIGASLTRSTRAWTFSELVDGVVRDVAAFRVVALADLVTQQFDGHPFAARQGSGEAEQRGWIERQTAPGPKGGRFTVLVATPAGALAVCGL